jgi:HTH-type transcriptional regulator, sugar sensing transcriptional regulator
MRLQDAALLDDLRFSVYEKKALLALVDLGMADAGTLCREADIPSSKIYRAMERLVDLGLAQIRPARPKLFASPPPDVVVDRLIELSREKAERFASAAETLRRGLSTRTPRLRGRPTVVDLALGHESHVRRHLTRLTAAKQRILSYLELGDLQAIDRAVAESFPVLRRISRNASKHGVEHRVIFGFSLQTAPRLVEFLHRHRNELAHATGLRYSGELGHPFHVIDERTVVLPLDHPFVPEGRFASMLVEDAELAQNLTTGFEGLWRKAMRDLREIDFHPGARPTAGRSQGTK